MSFYTFGFSSGSAPPSVNARAVMVNDTIEVVVSTVEVTVIEPVVLTVEVMLPELKVEIYEDFV